MTTQKLLTLIRTVAVVILVANFFVLLMSFSPGVAYPFYTSQFWNVVHNTHSLCTVVTILGPAIYLLLGIFASVASLFRGGIHGLFKSKLPKSLMFWFVTTLIVFLLQQFIGYKFGPQGFVDGPYPIPQIPE